MENEIGALDGARLKVDDISINVDWGWSSTVNIIVSLSSFVIDSRSHYPQHNNTVFK